MMKEIILKNNEKLEELEDLLNEIQKRSNVRTISVDDIIGALIQVEYKLDIPKKAMDGIYVEIDCNAQNFPRAYKYTPVSTIFNARYKNGSWRITSIERSHTKSLNRGFEITLTPTAEEYILNNYRVF